jgi:hypothetical protein
MCLECGEPVSAPENKPSVDSFAAASSPSASTRPARPRKRSRLVWILLAIVLLGIFWAATSSNPFAQGIQELAGSKQDETIVHTPFSISAHNFRYYKFSVAEGKHAALTGHFTVSSATPASDSDKSIEVYVMSESAFAVWQNGYAISNFYDSGRVSQSEVQAELPDTAGIYYLIFSNKFAPKATKKIDADIVLRYRNWMPESLRSAGARFWKFFGL